MHLGQHCSLSIYFCRQCHEEERDTKDDELFLRVRSSLSLRAFEDREDANPSGEVCIENVSVDLQANMQSRMEMHLNNPGRGLRNERMDELVGSVLRAKVKRTDIHSIFIRDEIFFGVGERVESIVWSRPSLFDRGSIDFYDRHKMPFSPNACFVLIMFHFLIRADSRGSWGNSH